MKTLKILAISMLIFTGTAMAEEGGSSISFYTPGADDKGASEALVAFSDCEIIEINSEMVMVINRQNGNQLIISPQVAEGLKTCTNFK